MATTFTSRKRLRKNYGRSNTHVEIPNLIELQKNSYDAFLQRNVPVKNRTLSGLNDVLSSIFPITDNAGKVSLEYVSYYFEEPKYDVEECLQRGMTYASLLRVKFRLVIFARDADTDAKTVKEVKEQDVYIGDMPLMTHNGTFVINGTERVVVSQMHRSPGVFFDHDKGKTHISGKLLYSAHIIPYRGSWLDFEFDSKDMLGARIDRRRKFAATTFLRALDSKKTEELRSDANKKNKDLSPDLVEGMSDEEILSTFYDTFTVKRVKDRYLMPLQANVFRGRKMNYDLLDEKGTVIVAKDVKVTPLMARDWVKNSINNVMVTSDELYGKFLAKAVVNSSTGEEIAVAGEEITEKLLDTLSTAGIENFDILLIDGVQVGPYIRHTLWNDKHNTREKALFEIYRIMYPGEPPTLDAAETVFNSLFFNISRYDLSVVGRVKINERFAFSESMDSRTLTKRDILSVLKSLIKIKDGVEVIDDIDHLGNRRVRSVGEMMENQFRTGLVRIDRVIRERMSTGDFETLMPQDFINSKPLQSIVHEFFGTSQLSQFMDQTNPLSEITHKRRLSALGPGGLTRERAGFEVRDVHITHYGRICPIETPEGQNIGLISSLATYASVNKYGFLETPYRKVVKGKVLEEVQYMTATQEGHYVIAQANAPLDDSNIFTEEFVNCRVNGEFMLVKPEDIEYIDVSPKQLVSVAASLIPFLENDDANRALMGSNMQRQAVPLLVNDAPLVGTGMEALVARDSGAVILAKNAGVVEQVDSTRIVVRAVDNKTSNTTGVDVYTLRKFQRSNHNTCINQKPIVKVGDKINAGDIIADGPSTDLGELALGRNILVAFMPWNGYNFEDSILVSERIVKEDVFTSIHIEEFEVLARDTKLGAEEITADIPNVGEEALRKLDESGVVHIGAEVKAGDILVGKVTPKGESVMSPEEKLLHAIFGTKAEDVRDSSLRVPSGVSGTIVGVRLFSRRGIVKDDRALSIDRAEIESYAQDREAERSIYNRSFGRRLSEILDGQKVVSGPKGIEKGKVLKLAELEQMLTSDLVKIVVEDSKIVKQVEDLRSELDARLNTLQQKFKDKVAKLEQGDDLPSGALKLVKVFIAVKRKLQPGDKMAGRHGNKGVVSRILPIEDMPYLEDGTPVDICLNPLGVPSRMNIGQILETHLGWASAGIGKKIGEALDTYQEKQNSIKELKNTLKSLYDKENSLNIDDMEDNEIVEMAKNLRKGMPVATPVFDGAREHDINELLEKAGLLVSGQMPLIDGRTGDYFDRHVTVGYLYMLKLHHLVDDKIHARSVGPYSLITQQPLGGKAQLGGQRFGEMEVWALEAYGAAYTLQEMLTIKSDDQAGRTKVYESIIKGHDTFETGIPESFNVLVKELRSLGLDIEMTHHSKN